MQTLVENCIKHAIAPQRAGGEVRIAARFESGELLVEVSDDGPGFDLAALQRGHGLENLQERMEALFGGEARLAVTRRDNFTVVALSLPQKRVLA